MQGRGTGWSVWDGAVAAAKHLEQMSRLGLFSQISPLPALELGSGTGLAGIAAAVATGLPFTLTDLPEILPALLHNVHQNEKVRHASDLNQVAPIIDEFNLKLLLYLVYIWYI